MPSVKDQLFIAAATGDIQAVDEAIQEYKNGNNNRFYTHEVKDTDQRTIAHYACLYNTEEVALHILEKRHCNTTDKDGVYPYMYAARRGFYQFLKTWPSVYGYDVKRTDGNGRTPVHYCCGGGADGKPSVHDIQMPTAKVDQAQVINCLQFLLNQGLDIDHLDKEEKSALQYAVENKYDDIVKWLLSNNSDPSWILQHKFQYPDQVSFSLVDVIKLSQRKNFDVYKILCKISDLTTDVHFEATSKNISQREYRIECAKTVFEYLGEFTFKPKKSALRSAVNTDFYEMIKFMSGRRAKIILDESQAIYESITHWLLRTLFEEQNTELLEERVTSFGRLVEESKLHVNAIDDRGMSPLHQLCGDTYETEPRTWHSLRSMLVEKILTFQPDIYAEDPKGHTPLMTAVENARSDVIVPLLAAGADPNRPNKWGKTALSLAKDKEVLALLQRKQNYYDKEAQTADGQQARYKGSPSSRMGGGGSGGASSTSLIAGMESHLQVRVPGGQR